MPWLVRENLRADILHHEGLCPAQAEETDVTKSAFKLDNILDIGVERPDLENLLPSC